MVGLNRVEGGEKEREKKKEKKRGEEDRSEKLQLLFRFAGDQIVGSGRSKRQSWSTHRGLCVGKKISGFHQTLRGRSFSYTQLNSYLRAIQMEGVFGAETATQLNPEILGLNAGIFRTVSDSSGMDFWDYFLIVWKLNFETVLGSPKIDFRTVNGPCMLFFLMCC